MATWALAAIIRRSRTSNSYVARKEMISSAANPYADTSIFSVVGNDVLMGYFGEDRLVGGSGNDKFNGGAAIDTLYGQSGADQFYAKDLMNRDIIKDWEDGIDLLNFSIVDDVTSFADINVSNGSLGAFVWWDNPSHGFWLEGQATNVVDATDFIF